MTGASDQKPASKCFHQLPFTRQASNLRLKQCRAVENKIFARCPIPLAGGAVRNWVYSVRRFQRSSVVGLVEGAAGRANCQDRQDRRANLASGSTPWSSHHERPRERIPHRSHCDTSEPRFKSQEDLAARPRPCPSQSFDSTIAWGSPPQPSNRTSDNAAWLGDAAQIVSPES